VIGDVSLDVEKCEASVADRAPTNFVPGPIGRLLLPAMCPDHLTTDNVRYRGQARKYMFAVRFTHFDPKRSSSRLLLSLLSSKTAGVIAAWTYISVDGGAMLLTRDKLLERLDHQLESARQIDVAVAWACECDALDRLRLFARNGGSLRAIIGISGNATQPSALRTIQKCGQLRIATRVERLFHPKFYLFHGNAQRIGWIGSANLTRPGFQQNEEIVFEFLDDDGKALEWFNDQWNTLGDCDAILGEYEQNWKPPSPPPRTPDPYRKPVGEGEIYDLAGGLTDWSSFVAAIAEADEYWSTVLPQSGDRPVTGEGTSWLETITRGRAVAHREDWSELSEDDRHLLLGRHPYGLLGGMGGAGHANNVFRVANRQHLQIRRTIREALQPAIDADDDIFAQRACDFIATVSGIEGFGGAIATRFLALARPDRAISVNRGSKTRLAELTGLPENSLSNAPHGRARSYLDLLRWFESQAWYSNPTPENAFERLLASARAALVDAFVYEEQ
jgi:PLD-like domain